ncbi:MAG: hypothetical protein WAO76_11585 [Georgfuchsia sp.]
MTTRNLSARLLSACFASALLALSLYMGGISSGDWLARYVLAGNNADDFTRRICGSIPGCQSVSVQTLFSWREAHRYLAYQVTGTRIDHAAATETIKRVSDDTTGLLGFAVKTAFRVDVRNSATRSGQ